MCGPFKAKQEGGREESIYLLSRQLPVGSCRGLELPVPAAGDSSSLHLAQQGTCTLLLYKDAPAIPMECLAQNKNFCCH